MFAVIVRNTSGDTMKELVTFLDLDNTAESKDILKQLSKCLRLFELQQTVKEVLFYHIQDWLHYFQRLLYIQLGLSNTLYTTRYPGQDSQNPMEQQTGTVTNTGNVTVYRVLKKTTISA